MTIYRFDEIPGLVCYFSGAESDIAKSGDQITSVDSVYGSQAIQLTQLTASTNYVRHDDITMVGAVPAFIGLDSKNDHGLKGTFTSTIESGACSFAVLEQSFGTGDQGYTLGCDLSNGDDRAGLIKSSNYQVRLDASNKSTTPSIPVVTTPVVYAARCDADTSNNSKVWANDVIGTTSHTAVASGNLTDFCILNENGGTWASQSNIAIAVVYDRVLEDAEMADVVELIGWWRDNGVAPQRPLPEITRFDEISDLRVYYNAAESNITKSGNDVNAVDSVYGDDTAQLVPRGVDRITHDGVTKINECLAFDGPLAGSDALLTTNLATPLTNGTPGYSIGLVEQRHSVVSTYSFIASSSDGGSSSSGFRVSDPNYALRHKSVTYHWEPLTRATTEPATIVARFLQTAHQCSINGTELTQTSSGSSTDLGWIGVGGSLTSTSGFNAKWSMLVVYGRKLTDIEAGQVAELLNWWRFEGRTPTIPAAGAFTITVDMPDAAGLAFQWEESSDNTNWQNIGTILTDTEGATTATLSILSATVAMHQTYVRCQVTTTDDGADTSDTAQLLIEGQ